MGHSANVEKNSPLGPRVKLLTIYSQQLEYLTVHDSRSPSGVMRSEVS